VDENAVDTIRISEILHKIWSDWAKSLLRECIINPDGSRTIPVDVMRKYIDGLLASDTFELINKYETDIEELLLIVLKNSKEE
jgi:hypothetical protein